MSHNKNVSHAMKSTARSPTLHKLLACRFWRTAHAAGQYGVQVVVHAHLGCGSFLQTPFQGSGYRMLLFSLCRFSPAPICLVAPSRTGWLPPGSGTVARSPSHICPREGHARSDSLQIQHHFQYLLRPARWHASHVRAKVFERETAIEARTAV